MSRIPQTFLDDLLYRIDIVELIDSRVKLRKAGKNYSACCPFHEEKTPSFTVSPDKQFYYCFGCGASGNALGFVMEYDRVGFVEAVENLAHQTGMDVPKESTTRDNPEASRQKHLYRVLKQASHYFSEQLKKNPQREQAINYLKARGLSGQIAKTFGIGLAPPGSKNLLDALGKGNNSIELLVESGLIIENDTGQHYDRFRNRILFPILDTRGRVIGFGGRVLDNSKPKYLNSPETPVFHKSRELYGLYQARQAERKLSQLIVVEGYMDVIALAQYGIHHAVATLGTACGEEHLRLAFRFVNEVVFCFDGDQAGRTAAKRALLNALSSMTDGRQIRFLFLPEGQDPDSLVRRIGKGRFLAQVDQAVPLEEFLFDAAAEGIDVQSMEGRARFSKLAAPMLNQIPEGVYRELMFANLAKRTGLDAELIQELTKEKINLLPPKQDSARLDSAQQNTRNSEASTERATSYEQNPNLHNLQKQEYRDTAQQHGFEKDGSDKPGEPPHRPSSRLTLSPAKCATMLLLDNPELLSGATFPETIQQSDDKELNRLFEIMAYLKKRNNSNFNSILGYWGGAKGVEAQQELAALAASEWMRGASTIDTYDAAQALQDALDMIAREQSMLARAQELAELKATGLSQLSEDQKIRYRELVKQSH